MPAAAMPKAPIAGLSHFLQFLLIPHGSSCVLHEARLFTSPLGRLGGASFSPPAAFFYCARRLAIACVTGLYWHLAQAHVNIPHKAPSLCAHHPAAAGFYCAPQSLALAVRLRSFVPHSLRRPLPARNRSVYRVQFGGGAHSIKNIFF